MSAANRIFPLQRGANLLFTEPDGAQSMPIVGIPTRAGKFLRMFPGSIFKKYPVWNMTIMSPAVLQENTKCACYSLHLLPQLSLSAQLLPVKPKARFKASMLMQRKSFLKAVMSLQLATGLYLMALPQARL